MWYHIPSTAWQSVQASEDWSFPSTSRGPSDIELSVTSSGTPMQRPLSWRGWKTRPYLRLLFGTTLPPSIASRGVEAWMSSLRASRASRGPSPETKKEPRTSDGYGPRSQGSLGKWNPESSSWRTSRRSDTGDSGGFSGTWPTSGTMRSGECYQLEELEPPTNENASSFWGTVTTRTSGGRSPMFRKGRTPTAREMVEQGRWFTPKAKPPGFNPENLYDKQGNLKTDPTGRFYDEEGLHRTVSPKHQWEVMKRRWATPRAADGYNRDARKMRRERVETDRDLNIRAQTLYLMQETSWPTPQASTTTYHTLPRTGEKVYTLRGKVELEDWPTPHKNAYTGAGTEGREGGMNIQTAVDKWPTPLAGEAKGRVGGENWQGGDLTTTAKGWPTPAARDWKGPNAEKHIREGTGRGHIDQLPNWVAHRFHLGRQRRGTDEDGDGSSGGGRRLNPRFVEWLMALPIGWSNPLSEVGATGFVGWVTRWYRYKERLLSNSSPRELSEA